ncbi:MAG: spermidine synthase [SAR202 cluster bacterium Io17-Chloro-G9]|nr:MAG: spermidine synthase [SAR202 cluster bacterium Io17-Chloro-G9]
MDISGKWFLETVFPDLVTMLQVRKVLYSGQTQYQKVEVLESDTFGRSLVLDGKTQSTERDEFIYHEALVHPAMLLHPGPRTVFIGGGGEGGTLREVLTHRSVERVVMLDLDQQVVDLCRRFLPLHNQGSFEDAKVELLHQDARQYLAQSGPGFDVMIMDLVDPMEGGPAYLLYTEEYYKIAKARLNQGGILVTQAGPAGLLSHQECFTTIYKTLATAFNHVVPLHAHVPAFQTLWGFTMASDQPFPSPTEDEINGLISQRITKELGFYDGETHRNMSSLPKFLRNGIREEGRINRDAEPVFMV